MHEEIIWPEVLVCSEIVNVRLRALSVQLCSSAVSSGEPVSQCMVGDVTVEWELPSGGLYIMPSRHGVAAAFAAPGEHNYRLVLPTPSFARTFFNALRRGCPVLCVLPGL